MGLTAGKEQRDELLQRAQQLCQAFAERKSLEEAQGDKKDVVCWLDTMVNERWWG